MRDSQCYPLFNLKNNIYYEQTRRITMIDVDIMIQVYKKEIERLMEENTLLKMHLAQKEKEAKEAKEKEKE